MKKGLLFLLAVCLLSLSIVPLATASVGDDIYAPIDGKEYSFVLAPYQRGPVDEDAKLVTHFEEKYGVGIEILSLDQGSYYELLSIRFASREIPDVFRAEQNLKLWAEQGVLMEIDEKALEAHSPNTYQYSLDAAPNVFRLGRVNGKLYGLCEIPRGDIRYASSVMRGDWLENLNLEMPVTFEEYENVFYQFTNNDPDGNGVKDTYGLSTSGFGYVFGSYGIPSYMDKMWMDTGDGLVYSPIMPESRQVVEILAKWYQDGIIDPEFITTENNGGYWALSHAFINGRIGYTGHGGYGHWAPALKEGAAPGAAYLEVYNLNPTAAEKLVYPHPMTGENGLCGNFGGGQSNPVLGNVIHVFGSPLAEEPDRFGKWLEIMDDYVYGSEENFIASINGIQGEDWEFGADGLMTPIGKNAEDANYINTIGGFRNFAFYGPENFPNAQHANFLLEAYLDNNFYKEGVLHQGRLPSVKTDSEIRLGVELDKIVDEAYIDMITGAQPIDYFDEFVTRWEQTGGTQVTEELNAWYSDFWQK